MSDAEIICAFMERKPETHTASVTARWWGAGYSGEVIPWPLSLDRLREVESRLTVEQLAEYDERLADAIWMDREKVGHLYKWHASAAQKIKTLAQVIRGNGGRAGERPSDAATHT